MEFKGKLSEVVPKGRGIRFCWVCESAWDDDSLIASGVECPNGCGCMEKYPSVEYAIRQAEGHIEWLKEVSPKDVLAAEERLLQLQEMTSNAS